MAVSFTPEIDAAISAAVNTAFYKIGLGWFIATVLVAVGLYFAIAANLKKRDQRFLSNLEKEKAKDVEIWRHQKDLMFEFVEFLDSRVFTNPKLDKTKNSLEACEREEKDVMQGLNIYYGKLYLVMDAHILKKINQFVNGPTTNIIRFHLYKELRKQLMRVLDKKIDDDQCPYIAGLPNPLIFSSENGVAVERPAKGIVEAKEHYPFLEAHEDDPEKIKIIPFFSARDK